MPRNRVLPRDPGMCTFSLRLKSSLSSDGKLNRNPKPESSVEEFWKLCAVSAKVTEAGRSRDSPVMSQWAVYDLRVELPRVRVLEQQG